MAPLRLICPLLVLAASALVAADNLPGRAPVEIRFVPPGSHGTVSLGIYDSAGKLVRILCDEWTFSRFRIGLNGLSTDWDGLDDTGQPVAAGAYRVRGFMVGDVEVAGSAFHFNDWIETEDSPRIIRVGAQQILPGGDMLLAARLAGGSGALVRYSPDSLARWRTVVSEPRPGTTTSTQLAVSDTLAFVLMDGRLRAANLETGAEEVLPVAKEGIRTVAARGDRLVLAEAGGLRFFRLPDFRPGEGPSDVPADFVSLALTENGLVASAADGAVWRWEGGWSREDLPSRVAGVASGRGDTFWVLEDLEDGTHAVAQYSPAEGRLAEWIPKAEAGSPAGLTAAPSKDHFAVTLNKPGSQRTVAIRRSTSGSGWEFVVDKTIVASAAFGWLEGTLQPDGGELPQSIPLALGENPLDPTAPQTLDVLATTGASGSGLSASDGLPLLRVSDSADFTRAMIIAGEAPGSARFFQGDGACVEEFAISNLGKITAFDAGQITMTPSGEATPPPPVDPEE